MARPRDRAGVTGSDGPSHHRMCGLPLLAAVPGLRIAAPRDAARLRSLLRSAVDMQDGHDGHRCPPHSQSHDHRAALRGPGRAGVRAHRRGSRRCPAASRRQSPEEGAADLATGWCAGVDRAMQAVGTALALYRAPVYIRHEIAHTKYVVRTLQKKGAISLSSQTMYPGVTS
ncbi:hypothetical protein LKL35_35755 [Streptomyces sp. ET3-23]|nr:hypothetical protein [Streptomyces sp. ET3-23]MCC2280710.1 hypothetical protein [Streptomyces sp. ET3-23]